MYTNRSSTSNIGITSPIIGGIMTAIFSLVGACFAGLLMLVVVVCAFILGRKVEGRKYRKQEKK